MRDDSSGRKLVEPTESLFADTEAPTSRLRSTPFLPKPSTDLRDSGGEPANPYSSDNHPVQTPSSRLGELYPFPQDPTQAVDAVNELLAKSRVRARASSYSALPPLASSAIDAQPAGARTYAVSVRRVFLLVLDKLFGFIADVFRPRSRQRPARAPSEHLRAHDHALRPPIQSGVHPVAKQGPAPRLRRDIQ
jgi:hypothetical protein